MRKVTITFVMPVRLSACNNSAPSGRIYMKFGIWGIFENLSRNLKVPLRSDKNMEHVICNMCVYDNSSLKDHRMRNIIITIIIIIFINCNWVGCQPVAVVIFHVYKICSGNLESWELSQHSLIHTGKPRKTCVEVAGRRTFRILTYSQQSGM